LLRLLLDQILKVEDDSRLIQMALGELLLVMLLLLKVWPCLGGG